MPIYGWILVVEDNDVRRRQLAVGLEELGGFQVCTAQSAAQARALLDGPHAPFDAVLLHDRLPDGDGRAVCTGMRHRNDWTPVIIMAGTARETEAVRSFDAGADDHVSRPSMAELSARIRVQMRAAARAPGAVALAV